MNNYSAKKVENPQEPIFHRVGEKMFDEDWNGINVIERKSWRYIVVKGKQIGVSSFKDESGIDMPIWFGFVFEGIGDFDYLEAYLKNV